MVGSAATKIVCIPRNEYSNRLRRQNLERSFNEGEKLRVIVGQMLVSQTLPRVLLCGIPLLPRQVPSPARIENEPSQQEEGGQHHWGGGTKSSRASALDQHSNCAGQGDGQPDEHGQWQSLEIGSAGEGVNGRSHPSFKSEPFARAVTEYFECPHRFRDDAPDSNG